METLEPALPDRANSWTDLAIWAGAGVLSRMPLAPDQRYVETVTSDPAYETVFLDMDQAGMGVTLKKR